MDWLKIVNEVQEQAEQGKEISETDLLICRIIQIALGKTRNLRLLFAFARGLNDE